METGTVEATGSNHQRIHLYGIRWPAVFAGLAVGLSVSLLLMLIGAVAGLAVFGMGGRPGTGSISVAAGLWNAIGMFVAALIGGYVAARASGLRRSADGMLHGAVSWGATMLCFVFLTGALTGNALSGIFGIATSPAAANIAQTITERSPSGSVPDTDPADEISNATRAGSVATAWLSVVILLSLVGSAGGGLFGVRALQKRALGGKHGEHHRVIRNDTSPHGGIPSAG